MAPVAVHPLLPEVRRAGVVAVLRAASVEVALRAVDAVVRGGVSAVEVTYSTPDVATVLAELARRFGSDVILGAGTLTTSAQVIESSEAGAQFLVSPGFDTDVVTAMSTTGRLTMVGGFTPTEVQRLARSDVDVVKLFPGSLGGPAMLRALRGPFPDLVYVPTGGVTESNLGDWFEAGALAVGAGGELIPRDALAREDYAAVTERAVRFIRALVATRG